MNVQEVAQQVTGSLDTLRGAHETLTSEREELAVALAGLEQVREALEKVGLENMVSRTSLGEADRDLGRTLNGGNELASDIVESAGQAVEGQENFASQMGSAVQKLVEVVGLIQAAADTAESVEGQNKNTILLGEEYLNGLLA